MEKFITLSREEIVLGFVSSCVEFVAAALKRSYDEIYQRMQKTKMLKEYIYRHYEALHCDSRENVTEELIELLERREREMQQPNLHS